MPVEHEPEPHDPAPRQDAPRQDAPRKAPLSPACPATRRREARLAEALRANLKRRKAQARGRAGEAPGGGDGG